MMPLLRVSYRALLSLALFHFAGASASPRPGARPIKQVRYMMGTLCEITVFPPAKGAVSGPGRSSGEAAPRSSDPGSLPGAASNPEDDANAAIDAAFTELKRIDSVLSNWKADSALMRMNLSAGAPGNPRPWVKVSEELFDRLQAALRIARETDGLFDPTVGPLVRAWGFLPPCATALPCKPAPRAKAIEEARQRVGWKKVRLDAQNKQVQFALPGMEIDLGGIAKGYAAECAIRVLRERGIRSALVNLGNSSLKALGEPARGSDCEQGKGATDACRGWPLLVVDPRDGVSVAAEIYLRDGDAVATSGTYERTIGKGRNRRSHLIDPHTGEALGGETSVTVLSSDAEVADALTKPFILRRDVTSVSAGNILALHPDAGVLLLSVKNGRLRHAEAGQLSRAGTERKISVYSLNHSAH